MEYVVIGILSIGCITLGFTTFNLLRKVEKIEDVVIRYDRFISEYTPEGYCKINFGGVIFE